MSPTCAADIKKYTSGRLARVLDVITDTRSQTICGDAFARAGGIYAVLELPSEFLPIAKRRTIKTEFVVGLAASGKEIALDDGYERSADPMLRARAAQLFDVVQQLLDAKKFRPHPPRVIRGGFDGILQGLQILRSGGTSGEKLVSFIDSDWEDEYLSRAGE